MTTTIANQPLRPLDTAEMDALRASIAGRGQQVPILRHASTGELIDGHHRLAICAELGLEPRFEDVDCTPERAEDLRVELNVARRQLSAAEVQALQLRLIRDVYPTTPSPRSGGGAGKAQAVARHVGEQLAAATGRPVAEVTPSRREVQRAVREPAGTSTADQDGPRPQPAEMPVQHDPACLLVDASKQQLLARMCELAACTPLQLGQALVERGTSKLNNPAALKPWVEGRLSLAMRRHIVVGAHRN